jgi:arsenate reductase (glutaredoxin)
MATPIRLYGIPNCDTVRKARAWLTGAGLAHEFHDFRKSGLDDATLERWIGAVGIGVLVNRKGTTWRALDAAPQAAAETPGGARQLMLAQHSVIKRPVVEWPDGSITVGFDPGDWTARLRPR